MISSDFLKQYSSVPETFSSSTDDKSLTIINDNLNALLSQLNDDGQSDCEILLEKIENAKIDITSSYDSWLRILFAIADQFGEKGRDYAHRISQFHPEYNYDTCNKQYDCCLRSGKSGITIRSLFYIAQQHGVLVRDSDPFSGHFSELGVSLPSGSFCLKTSDATKPQGREQLPAQPVLFDPAPPLSPPQQSTAAIPDLTSQSGLVAPFPVHVFPKPVSEFIMAASKSIGCPPDFLAIPVLAVLATAIGNSRSIQLKKGWIEGPRIFSAVVANPGSKKSPALAAATRPIRDIQKSFCAELEKQESEYQLALSTYNIQLELWKKRKPEDKNPEEQPHPPVEPVLQQIKTSNATMEAIGKLLSQNKRGILFEQDELAAWVKSMNAYRSGKGSDLEHWLSFWNGSQTIINRVSSKKPQIIDQPFVNVTGCIQPDLLSDLSGIKQNGFFDRILPSFPEPIPQHYSADELPDSVSDAYSSVVSALFNLEPDVDQIGNNIPALLKFSELAQQEWEKWNHLHDEEINSPGLPYYLKGVWSKLQAYMARFIMIIHLSDNAASGLSSVNVQQNSVVLAAGLVEYFKSHIRKVYKELFNSEMDRRVVLAVSWINRHGGTVTARMLLTNNVGKCTSAQQVNELLTEMAERNLGSISKSIPEGGGRASILFTLHNPANEIKTV